MATRKQDYQDRITVDPNILVGKPVITGTRIPVSLILNLLAHGYNFQNIIASCPTPNSDDIRAARLDSAIHVNRQQA